MADFPQATFKVEMDTRVMTYKPGDKIVVEYPHNLSPTSVAELKETFKRVFEGEDNQVVVLVDGMTLRVLSKEDG